ncbi:MAG: hypothetical protein RRA92_10180 [Gemmatimonadota bacterium]|nr:hypothetical protein [Gemmatimonadota bacterium]
MASLDRTTRDGLAVGFIGYLAVAVFYGALDFLSSRGPLYTVNVLGRALFRGLRDTGVLQYPVRLDPTAIVLYNFLHFVAALAIGLVVLSIVDRAERHPSEAGRMFALLVGGFAVTVVAVGLLSTPIRPVLPWWSIVVANVFASLTAAVYLVRRRPGVVRRILPFASPASDGGSGGVASDGGAGGP